MRLIIKAFNHHHYIIIFLMSSRKDFENGRQKKSVSKGRRRTTAGWGGIKKSTVVLFVVVFVVLFKVSFFLKKFHTFSTTRRDHDAKKKEKEDNNVPPRRALSTESSGNSNNRARDLGINAFRLNTFNLDETFPRRFILPKTSNETSSVGEAEKEKEGEEESQQFLAKLIDAFMKQNSALYDAKMKALGGVRSSLDDDDDDAFVSSSFPLQRLRRVDACEPRCEGEFRRTGGFGLLPQFFANAADPNWDSLENRLNATRENAREFFAHFAEFYVQDEDEEDEAMKTALKIFNGLVTAKDDRLLYNGMNSNNNNVILRALAGEERDVIRKAMLMGKEMS
jgi:hypothetical protein